MLAFQKYQGAGNDFIMIDNRALSFPEKDRQAFIARMCDRHFGIGGDGLILMEKHIQTDFEMRYFNSDGHPSSMCGNGGRCAIAYAHKLGIITDEASFVVNDALYRGTLKPDGTVALHMQNVAAVEIYEKHCFTDTGSPHHVEFVDDVHTVAVPQKGRAIRWGSAYGESGSNVNFVAPLASNRFAIRTYERGVEDETLACGTGAVAAALALHTTHRTEATTIVLKTLGGDLQVSFRKQGKGYSDIVLSGPAEFVYNGQWFYG